MTKSFLLVTNQAESTWLTTLKNAVEPLGRLSIIRDEAAEREMTRVPFDMVIIDAAAVENAIALVSQLHVVDPKALIVLATLSTSWRHAREALRAGAVDYVPKSLSSEELSSAIANLLNREALPSPNLPSEKDTRSMLQATLLLADNDPDFLATWKEFLEQAGYAVIPASNPAEAKQKLEIGGIDLAILDIRLQNDDDDRDLSGLVLARKAALSVPKIILTSYPTFEYVREALRPQLDVDGLSVAVDFLEKREGPTALLSTVQDILATVDTQRRGAQLRYKVFVAHGHDLGARSSVADFLQSIGVKPIILSDEPDRGYTIIEKLEECCHEAAFAIVLFTPDDFGYPKDNPNQIKARARQNAVFELGYLIAKLGRRRVRMLYREVEIPTNLSGVLYIEMDSIGKWKPYLIRELKDVGIPVTAKATLF